MSLVSCEYKEFQFGDKQVVLDIERNMLYQVDEISSRIVQRLRSHPDSECRWIAELEREYSSGEVQEALGELKELELIHEDEAESCVSVSPQLPAVQALCLHLVHYCNLRCTYCYGRGGEYGTPGESMSYSTAVKAVEFLLEQIPSGKKGNISFFGGEPLLRWDLLKRIIPYIRRREQEKKRKITLSLSANGTLLNDEIVHFLHHHRVPVTISLDGPPHIHDRMRVFPNGTGSYYYIFPKIKKLLQVQGRCPMRATLDPNEPRLTEVVEHLLQIGATLVHTEPASGLLGKESGKLSSEAVENLKKEYRRFKEKYIRAIQMESKLLPFFAFIRILRMLTGSGQRRYYGCGMGRSYVAVSPRGEFYPCHRFVDQKKYLLGDLDNGLSKGAREQFVALQVRQRESCRSCWARYLCGGGCYYDAFFSQGDLEHPDPARCELYQEVTTEAIEIGTHLSQIPPQEIREMGERLVEYLAYL